MKICNRCILPETFPGIHFDAAGICNHCTREAPALAKAGERKEAYRRRLDDLIAGVRGSAPTYDAILAYSGGKDSSYTLKLLRDRYDLRILALTFDNHFISPAAAENIRTVTDRLLVDCVTFKPPWPILRDLFASAALEDVFPAPTLIRASAICTACISMVKSLVLKTALEMSIPLVAFGWSPGQAPIQSAIMRASSSLTCQSQKTLLEGLPGGLASGLGRYFLPDGYYEIFKDRFPHNVHPLAFFDYDEAEIVAELGKVGWKTPADTDTNSSNCLLNAFANQCHLQRHQFHPYVWEIANMVRQGVMSRDEGIQKIYTDQDPAQVGYARTMLGLQ
ncbi:MAG: hypothetical protein GX443_00335 [Deltaproteobacteria bacterium]|nr:hypothetical protein [Deltaproteobacteria bacterium]